MFDVRNAHNIAIWEGNNWSPLGEGFEGDVFAIAITNNFVYAGGEFDECINR